MHVTLPSRGSTGPLLAVPFLVLSAIAVRELWLSPAARSSVATLNVIWSTGMLPTNSFHLRRTYTGISGVDRVLRVLVAIFLPAAAGWDPSSQLQQAYFLISAAVITAVWAAEAGKPRHHGRINSLTSVWALFYQTVGGAIVIPLYYVFYLYESSRPHFFAAGARHIRPSYAKALPAAVVLGSVLPTLAMYVPLKDDPQLQLKQLSIAVWQVAPWLVNALLVLLSHTVYSSAQAHHHHHAATKRTASAARFNFSSPVHVLYLVLFAVGAVAHITTLAISLRSSNPALAPVPALLRRQLVSDVVPGAAPGFFEAMHYLFQVDFLCIFAAVLLGELVALRDLKAVGLLHDSWAAIALLSTLGTVLVGPAATAVALAGLRDDAETREAKKAKEAKE